MLISNDKVFTVYSWFQSEMHRIGRNIKFPKCADKTKTYQFRWTKSFVEKCYNDLNLDDKMVTILIKNMVDYAKRNNLLDRGTQILSMGNIVDICHKSLKLLIDDEDFLIKELISCTMFLRGKAGDKNNLVSKLLESETGYCSNMLYWYNLGHLTEVFMALSKSCNQALSKLSQDERIEFPSEFELFKICSHTVQHDIIDKLISIMGDDLRVPPTVLIK